MKILILNGPNLNLLGNREPDIYGSLSLEQIYEEIINKFPRHEFEFFQSNIEGELINKIQNVPATYDALIINPGGYSHTSVAIRDALESTDKIKIEVHLSNIFSREEFRQKSLTASACNGLISGFKQFSYLAAVYLIELIADSSASHKP
ncbi:MAG: type II 3-dehydroquinate dehydratase [Ignavibacteriaceae bacterium]